MANVITKKLILGFKHIRFKSSVTSSPHKPNFNEVLNLRSNKLAEILDCTNLTAKGIIRKNMSILRMESDDFLRNSVFCSKYFKISEVVEFPIMLSLNTSMLQHRYFSLMELGCSNISACKILRFPQIIKGKPKDLAKEGIYFCHANSVNYFKNFLQNSEIIKQDEIKLRLQKMYEDGQILWKIKEAMNAEFLALKLNCSLFKAHEMFRRYPPLRIQSILITDLLLDVLFSQYNFSVSKVFQATNLLSLHHEIASEFLQKTPYILGIKTETIVNKQPLVLRRPVSAVHNVNQILKDFNVSDQQLLCCPRVVTFTPRTLRNRLEYLWNSEDFALLKSYKKFLWLVYHYNNLKPRLQALKAVDKPCSINMFIQSNSSFENGLCFGSQCRTHMKDLCHYLAKLLNFAEQTVLLKLQEFPKFPYSSVSNCNMVVEYLLGSGVSKKQLFNGLGVIFYDVDVVKSYFEELSTNPDYQPFDGWRTHYNLIQLLLYSIEVDSGFKGCHIHVARSRNDESEDVRAYAY